MAPSIYLASTLVMGGLLVLSFVLVMRGRSWRHYSPQAVGAGGGGGGRIGAVLGDGRTWLVGFVVLVLAATAGTLGILSGGGGTGLFIPAAALVLGGFMAVGTYWAARSRGHPHSHAVFESFVVVGGLVIIALVVRLSTNFGA